MDELSPAAADLIPEPMLPEPTPFAQATAEVVAAIRAGDYTAVTRYAIEHVAPGLLAAAAGLMCIFIGYLIAKYLMRIVSRPICRRVDETLGRFAGKMVFYAVMIGSVTGVASTLGVPLGGLAAAIAAAGFAIGLAFQGTLSNFAAGVLMLVFRPFKVGDVVTAAGVTGKVNEIDLFTTTLDTFDNRRLIVPNGSIAGGTIENVTHHAHRRIEIIIGVAYSADLESTRTALRAATERLTEKTVFGANRGSSVILANLGPSSVEWKVRVWVGSGDYWGAHEALVGAIKQQLDSAGITIPFPQMELHVNTPAGLAIADPSRGIRPTRRAA